MSTNHLQGILWGAAPTDWALYLETTFSPLYKKIISKSGLSAGKQLLDIGCGTGLFLRMAGATGASLTGIDASPEMLKVARERNPDAILLEQDMARLSLMEKKFDLVTGFNSLQYADDISKTLEEIKRVMKDDGQLVIGVWGSAEECEALDVLASIASLLPEPPAGSPGPLALSEAGKVETLLETGRRFQRLFLKIRERNMAIHPMTQILEEPATRQIVHSSIGISDNIQFILRTGYVKNYPQPVSLRRPVGWFVRS